MGSTQGCFDIAIVGAGIAGAGLAAAIGGRASVVLLEAESQPGYHATGRSAAFWSETYGGADIQPLTSVSGPALRDGGYLAPLGSLHVGQQGDEARADALIAEFAGTDVPLTRVDPRDHVPGLRGAWTVGVLEPSCAYIDVGRLHADQLSAARRDGARLLTGAALRSGTSGGDGWTLDTSAGPIRARVVVNAAGAWADAVAQACGVVPIGIRPYRRTMIQLRTDPPAPSALPLVSGLLGEFYFKPEAGGRLWLSPHDETATDPCDVVPEEIDVALAIERLERVVEWRVAAVERRWAGLRSFAPDRRPVFGFDARTPGFFWCAGQGGFGIQTAPAAAQLCAALLLDHPVAGAIDPGRYRPARLVA